MASGSAGGRIRRRLQRAVHRGRDPEALGQRRLAIPADHLEPRHLGDVGRGELDDRAVHARFDRYRRGCAAFRLRDLARLDHAPQHVRAARGGAFDAGDRIVERRGTRQARDQRRLREREVGRTLLEVHLGGGADAVGALPEEDPVEIERQDFLLAELALEPQCQEYLLELAPQRALAGEHRVARELHGDRAAALAHAAGREVAHCGTHQALPVHAGMLEEPVVFGGEECIDEQRRDLVPRDRHAPLLADLRDQLAIARIHAERHLRADLAQLGRVGNLGLEELVRAGEAERHQADDCEHNREQGHEQSRHERTHAQILRPSPCRSCGRCA
jgi:hypothetical protein